MPDGNGIQELPGYAFGGDRLLPYEQEAIAENELTSQLGKGLQEMPVTPVHQEMFRTMVSSYQSWAEETIRYSFGQRANKLYYQGDIAAPKLRIVDALDFRDLLRKKSAPWSDYGGFFYSETQEAFIASSGYAPEDAKSLGHELGHGLSHFKFYVVRDREDPDTLEYEPVASGVAGHLGSDTYIAVNEAITDFVLGDMLRQSQPDILKKTDFGYPTHMLFMDTLIVQAADRLHLNPRDIWKDMFRMYFDGNRSRMMVFDTAFGKGTVNILKNIPRNVKRDQFSSYLEDIGADGDMFFLDALGYAAGNELTFSNGLRHRKTYQDQGFEDRDSIESIHRDIQRMLATRRLAVDDVMMGFFSKDNAAVTGSYATNIHEIPREKLAEFTGTGDREQQRQLALLFPPGELEAKLKSKNYFPLTTSEFGIMILDKSKVHQLHDSVYVFNEPAKRPEALIGTLC